MINNKDGDISKFRENPIIKCIICDDFNENYELLIKDAKYVILKILLIIDSDFDIHKQTLLNAEGNYENIISKTKPEYKESLSYTKYNYNELTKIITHEYFP
jgi:hypothetical protein